MKCRKCGGRIVVDRLFNKESQLETYCIMCGKRWFLNCKENKFGKRLLEAEQAFRHYVVTL